MNVHKLGLSVTFNKLAGYFDMYNRTKHRGIINYTFFTNM